MDLNEVWQENKRFITTMGAGLLVFLIGWMVIEGLYSDDIQRIQIANSRERSKLKDAMFTADDRELARDENEVLQEGYATVSEAAAFRPRPEFVLDPSKGEPQNVYFTAVENVRERLTDLASRKRAFLPDGLDLEMVKTRNIDAIERNLHAIDLLERTLVLALESGVGQVRGVEVRLDPAFRSRRGLGAIEKTQVTIDAISTPQAAARWLMATQTPADGGAESSVRLQPLPIESRDARRASNREELVRTSVTFLVVRVNEVEEPDPDSDDA
ncbi:MAG: hypothetical protein AAGA20_17585 [Planctomycetota bacterium]